LEPYLEDIIGIYLVGSYARGEQDETSDIDIIAISNQTKKEIISGKYNISIITLEGAKKTIENNPVFILPSIVEAKVILNKNLLEELKKIKLNKNAFKSFIEDTKRTIKINRNIIDIDESQGFDYLDSKNIIYSLVLRLRGVFLIKKLISKIRYSKEDFTVWLKLKMSKEELKSVLNIYKDVKNNKKSNERLKINSAKKLLYILETEIKKLENEQKKEARKRN
ncbi:MAG: nucleotidyltransferase domain-containing protein, partial [Nanoarchaeota archaeon]